MNDKERIEETYRKYWEYMINKDEEGLRSLMTEDYYLRHMTGVQQSREEFLRGLMKGTFNYYSADHEAIEVELNGDTTEMIGKSRVLAAVYGGGKNRWRLRGDFTLRKENDVWKFTSSEASMY